MNTKNNRNSQVWYAAYGSNLCLERFQSYIKGGNCDYVPTAEYCAQGCDSSRQQFSGENRSYILCDYSLYFAGSNSTWSLTKLSEENSSAAFVREEQEGVVFSRIYKLSIDQFIDVFLQENGQLIAETTGEIRSFVRRFSVGVSEQLNLPAQIGDTDPSSKTRWPYGLLLKCGEVDGLPVLTFTATDQRIDEVDAGMPSTPYVRTIIAGLLQTYGKDLRRTTGELISISDYLESATSERWYHPLLDRMVKQTLHPSPGAWQIEGVSTDLLPSETRPQFARVKPTQGELIPIREPFIQVVDDGENQPLLSRPSFLKRQLLRMRMLRWRYHERVVIQSVPDRPYLPAQSPGVLAYVQRLRHASHLGEDDVGVNQKIRTALSTATGDRIAISHWTPRFGKQLTFLRWFMSNLLERVIHSQALLARAEVSTFVDMETSVVRLPSDVFPILGIEEGEQIVIESPSSFAVVRALPILTSVAEQRASRQREPRYGVYVDARFVLGIGRLKKSRAVGDDIPAILVDLALREKLGILPTDPVRVSRHAWSAIVTQLIVLLLPIALTLITGVYITLRYMIENDLYDWYYLVLCSIPLLGFFILVSLTVLLKLRKRVG